MNSYPIAGHITVKGDAVLRFAVRRHSQAQAIAAPFSHVKLISFSASLVVPGFDHTHVEFGFVEDRHDWLNDPDSEHTLTALRSSPDYGHAIVSEASPANGLTVTADLSHGLYGTELKALNVANRPPCLVIATSNSNQADTVPTAFVHWRAVISSAGEEALTFAPAE